MKVLVTGSQGQVGHTLMQHHHESIQWVGLTRTDCDITQLETLRQAIQIHQPDWLVNCAAFTAVDRAESEQEQALSVNHQGAFHVAKACQEARIPLCHLSTDYVFNGEQSQPYCEEDEAIPGNYYGFSKYLGEQAVQAHCEHAIILRVASVFGAHGHNFVKTVLRLASSRSSLNIVDDQRCCPTSAQDIAAAVVQIILSSNTQPAWGLYHYCGTPATTWHAFAKAIQAASTQPTIQAAHIEAISTTDYPTPARRPMNSVLKCDKIQHTFSLPLALWPLRLPTLITALESHLNQENA